MNINRTLSKSRPIKPYHFEPDTFCMQKKPCPCPAFFFSSNFLSFNFYCPSVAEADIPITTGDRWLPVSVYTVPVFVDYRPHLIHSLPVYVSLSFRFCAELFFLGSPGSGSVIVCYRFRAGSYLFFSTPL
jgi:hypothetical protein